MFPVGEPKFTVKVTARGGTLTEQWGSLHCVSCWAFSLMVSLFQAVPNVFTQIISMGSGGEAGLSPELKFHSPFYLWPQVCLIWKMPPLKPEFPSSESSGLPHVHMTLQGLCPWFQVTHGAPSLSLSLNLQPVTTFWAISTGKKHSWTYRKGFKKALIGNIERLTLECMKLIIEMIN